MDYLLELIQDLGSNNKDIENQINYLDKNSLLLPDKNLIKAAWKRDNYYYYVLKTNPFTRILNLLFITGIYDDKYFDINKIDIINYVDEALFKACYLGITHIVKKILKLNNFNRNYYSKKNETCLSVSVEFGHVEIVQLLLENNFTTRAKDSNKHLVFLALHALDENSKDTDSEKILDLLLTSGQELYISDCYFDILVGYRSLFAFIHYSRDLKKILKYRGSKLIVEYVVKHNHSVLYEFINIFYENDYSLDSIDRLLLLIQHKQPLFKTASGSTVFSKLEKRINLFEYDLFSGNTTDYIYEYGTTPSTHLFVLNLLYRFLTILKIWKMTYDIDRLVEIIKLQRFTRNKQWRN